MEKKPQLLTSEPLRFALYLVLLLPIIIMRDITPDNELKYLSIADEALRDTHLWCLFNHGIAYADKPPLYIWIIMFFKRILGFHCIPLLELFSLVPAFVILHIFNRWSSGRFDSKWMIAAEIALLTSVYFLGGAIVLRMDMLMVMFITISMYTFWQMYMGDLSLKRRIVFPLSIFLAIFSKGPVGIMVPLFCIPVFLLLNKEFRFMSKCWGWMSWTILAVLCAIWWVNVYIEGGRPYLDNLLFHQTVDRAVDAFHHKQPFYYYLYSIWYAMAPWCLITIPAIVVAIIKRVNLDPLARFFLIIAATIIVMMSVVSSKLVIYILPAFPFITYGAIITLSKMEAILWRKVIIAGSSALMLVIFAAGFFCERFNGRIGLGKICEEASFIAEKEGISNFGCYNLKGGDNMDAYLGRPVKVVDEEYMAQLKNGLIPEGGIIIITKGENGEKKLLLLPTAK